VRSVIKRGNQYKWAGGKPEHWEYIRQHCRYCSCDRRYNWRGWRKEPNGLWRPQHRCGDSRTDILWNDQTCAPITTRSPADLHLRLV